MSKLIKTASKAKILSLPMPTFNEGYLALIDVEKYRRALIHDIKLNNDEIEGEYETESHWGPSYIDRTLNDFHKLGKFLGIND